ncbi:DMT family transporter [Ramlibacter algicola]|uniref:EamA family transporter n=1 Tax=Ramlibacter algicola TaxID=2795217 RepID=A0A934Q487_9BURK|nr:DMT family transporter [Ramlibacter algicola]MBK0394903.1 EamA family transporter [Ramlibacter algicola]
MKKAVTGAFEMTAAMAISGTIGWFVVRSGQPVVALLFWRCVFGGAGLLPFCIAFGHLRRMQKRQFALAAGGGLAIALNWVLIFESFSHVPISVATAVYNTQPFILLGFGMAFLGERITAARLAWLALAFGGVVAIALGQPAVAAAGGDYPLGILLSIGAAFLYALAALATKKLDGTAPQLITLIHVGVGAVVFAPWGMRADFPVDATAWSSLAAMGFIYTALVFILLHSAIQKLPTAVTGALSFIYPVVAMITDVVAFDQRLSAAQWTGAAAILAGAVGIQLRDTRTG